MLILSASSIAMGAVMYILVMNYYNVQHSQEWPPVDDGSTMDDSALPNDPENAPDPYEDTIISQHKDDTLLIRRQKPQQEQNSFDDALDNISYAAPPSDQMSLLLDTSNQITPLVREDFGYGASVLVYYYECNGIVF